MRSSSPTSAARVSASSCAARASAASELVAQQLLADAPVLVLELLAPDLRADARLQHLELARLRDVVVGAGAEAVEHRAAILERRQHDQRNVAKARRRLDPLAGLLAAHARHQEVEQNAVDRLDREQVERLFAGVREDHVVALAAQRVGEVVQIGQAVVDGEDLAAHAATPTNDGPQVDVRHASLFHARCASADRIEPAQAPCIVAGQECYLR